MYFVKKSPLIILMFLFAVMSLENASAQHLVSSKKHILPGVFPHNFNKENNVEQPLIEKPNDLKKSSLPSLPSTFDYKKSKSIMRSQPNKNNVRLHVLPHVRLSQKDLKTN